MTEVMQAFVLQFAVIIIAARLGGSIFRRYLHLPRVLGELSSGMIVGPYALGAIDIPGYGPMFPLGQGPMPVSTELYAVATLASIILLFLAGLETDLATFLRYSVTGTVVGFFGVVFSFLLGDWCAMWFGIADSFMAPSALFLGTISTATSIGITARILSERHKTASPEGVTIMAAAVLDDVLGIILLTIVVGIGRVEAGGGQVPWTEIGAIAAKALGFWVVCMSLAMLTARRVSRLLKLSRTPATIASLSLGLALLLAGFSEMAGLAMIIGAYIAGLALSRTDLVQFLQEELQGVYMVLVPAFFCVMGMLVDFTAIEGAVVFGLIYTVVAIFAKVVGCGLPALCLKFNLRGAARVGIGMLPRGEVALIVAGIGYSSGVISADLFGVGVMMTVLTTLLAPPMLIKSFAGGPGVRGAQGTEEDEASAVHLMFPSSHIAEFLRSRIVDAFRSEEFFVHRLQHDDAQTYQIRKDDVVFSLTQNGPELILMLSPDSEHVARLIVLEELLGLEDMIESSQKMTNLKTMEHQMAMNLFNGGSTPPPAPEPEDSDRARQ